MKPEYIPRPSSGFAKAMPSGKRATAPEANAVDEPDAAVPPEHLSEAETPEEATLPQTSPWGGVILAIGAPLFALIVGYNLFLAINLTGRPASYAAFTAAVRTAITQAIDRDLTVERLADALSATTDPSPGAKDLGGR